MSKTRTDVPIGCTTEYNGFVLKVVRREPGRNCGDCFFFNLCYDCTDNLPYTCLSSERSDKTNVIFKKVR